MTLRILHLNDRISARGGADWHLIGVVEAQLEAGHQVTLAAGRDDGTVELRCQRRRVRGLDAAAADGRVQKGLDALAAELEPDVVHIHNAIGPDALAWAAAHDAVATVQDHRSFCPGRGKLTAKGEVCRSAMDAETCAVCFSDADYHQRIQALTGQRLEALRRMRRVTVLSRYMRDELHTCGVGPATVVPPFVHGLDESAQAAGPPCVLFVGRLVHAKGVHDAIEAWRRAELDLPLVLAGTGPLRGELEGGSLQDPNVEVLGWVGHDELSTIYRRARAVLVPSRWQEPFGIVGLEALQMGVPVVAWHSGGVVDWHPGDDLLVPWGDVDALAHALRRAVTRQAEPASGFDREELMGRLDTIYAS